MNTLESENNRHADQLAQKVSRLKNVRFVGVEELERSSSDHL